MIQREKFLSELFRSLEEQPVTYCVLRNFDHLFVDLDTDVDLLVTKPDLARFRECLLATAVANNYQLIQENRFVNYSYVLWDRGSRLLRIDVSTEERWRIFEVLSCEEILMARRRQGSFYVPHPNHEYVILVVQSIWTNTLKDRYHDRLTLLAAQCQDPAALKVALVRAFGPAGARLADSAHLHEVNAPGVLKKLRTAMILKTLSMPGRALRSARHFLTDVRRLLARVRHPPGIIVKVFSSSDMRERFHTALRGFEFLFPVKKFSIRAEPGADKTHVSSWRTQWQDTLASLRSLFRGGMDLQFHHVNSSGELSALVAQHCSRGGWYPARTFVCLVDPAGLGLLAHVGTGLMIRLSPAEVQVDEEFTPRLVQFVCSMLDRPRASQSASRRGLFCVLVGLDGSGKTTLARNIAVASANNPRPRFHGVRYYHWLPRPWKPVEFPFPASQDLPRTRNYPASPVNVALSCLRLMRNLLWAHLAYAFLVRRLRRKNYLVLLDRYFYNYFLDPCSLKYSAPTWLLNWALPFFPKPDAVILLKADPKVLQSRKQELSPDEITAQVARLETMRVYASQCIHLNAGLPADQVASSAFASILAIDSEHGTV